LSVAEALINMAEKILEAYSQGFGVGFGLAFGALACLFLLALMKGGN